MNGKSPFNKRGLEWLAATLAALLIVTLSAPGCGGGAPEIEGLTYVKSFEGGNLYRLGKLDVVVLSGTYGEMGRQYGALLKEKIRDFYDEVEETLLSSPEYPEGIARQLLAYVYGNYPERFKCIFEGMAETSGLDVEKLTVLDNVIPLEIARESVFQCSVIVAWGQYTGGEPLVMGRNYDWAEVTKDYDDTLAVVIYKPSDGSLPVMNYSNAGQVGSFQSFNGRGQVLEINMGMPGDTPRSMDRTSVLMEMTQWPLDCGSFDALGVEISSTRVAAPALVTVADAGSAATFELDVNDYRRKPETDDGLIVTTNHFVDPSWGKERLNSYKLKPCSSSVGRYNNFLAWAMRNKGGISVDGLKEILCTPYSSGGVFKDDTVTQFVYVPATLELWLRVPDYQDWTELPLKELFEESEKQ
ncbi:MAG: hypothetical protein JXA49_03985 [Actinobacteria bacterium]|nr:hypothetical protein [Actinomycetota bacterium]